MTAASVVSEWPLLVLTIDSSGSVTLKGSATAACGNRSDVTSGCDPFCEWSWDGTTLVAETDRYGFFPLFYYAWDRGIMISPSLSVLLDAGAPTDPDDVAISILLRRWTCFGQDTPFRHIRMFPAGGRLKWTAAASVQIEKRFVFGHATSMSRSAAIDGYIDCFRQAIKRRLVEGPAVVPLSGGRDSRHIFLELCSTGHPPDVAVSVAGARRTTPDSEVAAALAARAGVRHVALNLPESRWSAQSETFRATHYCTLEHWWITSIAEYLRQFDRQVAVYEGVAGDVLSTAIFKEENLRRLYDKGRFAEVANLILDPEKFFEQALTDDACKRYSREAAVARLVVELAEHADAPNPLASFFVYNRSRRVTALPPTTMLSLYGTVWCPYLDVDVWNHLSSLGPEFLENESITAFHDDAIRRAYPKFADIPFVARQDIRPHRFSYNYKTVVEMASSVAKNYPAIMRRSYLMPRLSRAMVDPSFLSRATSLAPLVGYSIALQSCLEGDS